MLLLLLAPLFVIHRGVHGAVTSSGTVQVSAKVPGPAPTTAAVITSPANNTTTTNADITVSGTCGADLTVKLFRNGIFAGETFCDSAGQFSLPITLYSGRNDLTALNYDDLDQAGPASPVVTVTYQIAEPSVTKTPINVGRNANLLLDADYHLRQIEPGIEATWQLTINFGSPPYHTHIDWGDTTSSDLSVITNGTFSISHSYNEPGKYKILISLHDSQGAATQLQLVVVVNGEPVGTGQTAISPCSPTKASALFCNLQNHSSSIISPPLYWLLLGLLATLWLNAQYHRWHRRKAIRGAGLQSDHDLRP